MPKHRKPPKRPLLIYYIGSLLVILLFNMLIMPLIMNGRFAEVDTALSCGPLKRTEFSKWK